jgi:hypothetical protein
MTFRGKVHDRGRLTSLQQAADKLAISDISAYELISPV